MDYGAHRNWGIDYEAVEEREEQDKIKAAPERGSRLLVMRRGIAVSSGRLCRRRW
jgi:hypothetical protein